MSELKSKCCGADIVTQYKVLKDGYFHGKGYKACSGCHKPIEIEKKDKAG